MAPTITLRDNILSWLLEDTNPSVKYLTQTEILGKKDTEPEPARTRSMINKEGWVKQILEKQREGQYWENKESCYVPKWTSCVWQIPVLADLEATQQDPRIRNACEHFLTSHNLDQGGFSPLPKTSDKAKPHICLTGNMIRALTHLGYRYDERIKKAADWLLSQQLSDGGWNCDAVSGGKHGSFSSTVQPVWALAELLQHDKNSEWESAAQKGAEFLLNHRLYRSETDGSIVMLDYTRFHYPIHYNYDILHGLRVLTSLGIANDKRLEDAANLLLKKRYAGGHWNLDGTYRGWRRTHGIHTYTYRPEEGEVIEQGWGDGHTLQLEEAGKPSKWITLTALRVIKRLDLLELESET